MEYKVNKPLTSFEFWSGAKDRAKNLTYDEVKQLDEILPEYLGGEDLPEDTDINDMFWFEFPTVCHALGYACVDDDPIREVDDFKESYRLEVLTDYAESAGWKYTEDQLKDLDAKCLDEGDAYELNADEDTFDIDDNVIEDYAKEVGIEVEE